MVLGNLLCDDIKFRRIKFDFEKIVMNSTTNKSDVVNTITIATSSHKLIEIYNRHK
jgi:hypothetical protein